VSAGLRKRWGDRVHTQRIIALLKKEFGQLFKDKKLLPLVFLAPVMQLVFLGYAASIDVKNIALVLCDLDKTKESRDLAEKFVTSGYFTIEYATDNYALLPSYLDDNKVDMALVIPRKFGETILRKEPARVQVLVDGSEGNTAAISVSYFNQIITQYSTKILVDVVGGQQAIGGVRSEVRAWYNPELRSRVFMVPGVLVLILLITTMNLTAMAIVREKEIGTLEQIMVTPILPWELIVGKLVPFIMIGAMNATVVMTVMVFWYEIPIRGSIPLLIGLSGCFLLTTVGLGLFISTISHTQQQAMMVSMFFILQPMMYLSGFNFPIENMPPILQSLSWFVPMRYYLVIVRSLILKGVGLKALWLQGLILLVMGGTVLTASILRFRKKLD
jgi:ABC-2 type transport system permease protein